MEDTEKSPKGSEICAILRNGSVAGEECEKAEFTRMRGVLGKNEVVARALSLPQNLPCTLLLPALLGILAFSAKWTSQRELALLI